MKENILIGYKEILAEAKMMCYLLGIGIPRIEVIGGDDFFSENPTLLSCVEVEVDENGGEKIKGVYIRDKQADRVNCLFNLAHELRHVWQHENGIVNVNNYIERSRLNVEQYNEQYAEIDANAFAMAYMRARFRVDMKLENTKIPNDVIAEIRQLADAMFKKIMCGELVD